MTQRAHYVEAVRPAPSSIVWAALAIALLSLSLRTGVTAASPILGVVSADLGLSITTVSILAALPPVAFAVSAFVVKTFGGRWTVEGMTLLSALGLSCVLVMRAFATGEAMFLVLSMLSLFAMGVGNVVIPPLIKRYFASRVALMSAVYAGLLSVSATLPPLLAGPMQALPWREQLGVWGILALLSVPPIAVLRRHWLRSQEFAIGTGTVKAGGPNVRVPAADAMDRVPAAVHRSRVVWSITLAMTVASVVGYFLFAWLPTILIDTAGIDAGTAGLLLALFAMLGFPVSLVAPLVLVSLPKQWILFVAAGAVLVSGFAGLLLAPHLAPLWVVLLGLGQIFNSMAIALVNGRTTSVGVAMKVSAFMQTVAYGTAAGLTLLLGWLHAESGSWTLSLVCLVAISAIGLAAGRGLGRRWSVEQEIAVRDGRLAKKPRAGRAARSGG